MNKTVKGLNSKTATIKMEIILVEKLNFYLINYNKYNKI